MANTFTAIMKQDGNWWIGWIEEVPGVNCQEKTREGLLESLSVTLKEALEFNNFMNRFGLILLAFIIFPIFGGMSLLSYYLYPVISFILNLLIPGFGTITNSPKCAGFSSHILIA